MCIRDRFRTALHYLTHNASTMTRWAVRPATLTLLAWARRADITADRAGVLCARSVDVSLIAMQKAFPEDDSRELARRYRAIQRFSGSLYYRTVVGQEAEDGESTEDCDAAVANREVELQSELSSVEVFARLRRWRNTF